MKTPGTSQFCNMPDSEKSQRPFHVLTKPIGPICNLDCKYCFYLEKEVLYDEAGSKWQMSSEVLETYIRDYIQSNPGDEIHFAWQGGEPTLLGVDFFRRAFALQKKYAEGRTVRNAFQTNGTLLNDEWCTFLRENEVLVGVSIDGPEQLHDSYRVNKKGGGTWKKVMAGIELLQKHKVEFNTLACVNRNTAKKPLEIYRFLKSIGCTYLQFIPIVERQPDRASRNLSLELAHPPDLDEESVDPEDDPRVTYWTVRQKDFGPFLCKIFDRWLEKDVGNTFVQLFDVALGKWLGMPGGLCLFDETCGRALAIEHNGDVYSCDHFVYPHYRLGNIMNKSLGEMVDTPGQARFATNKRDRLPEYCRSCDVRFACNDECPKNRFAQTPDGDPGLNYLCPGYKEFFRHIDPAMRIMTDLIRRGRVPSGIKAVLKADPGLLKRMRSTNRPIAGGR
jgi:uncharacterized protein